jgi:hypothetical protein
MPRPLLEVADIFRRYGPQWRQQQKGHLSLGQLKVMSAIENCRTDHLGGHVLFCDQCQHQQISYNSCRNRHCPKCQASAAKRWLVARQQDLLPVEYYHVVFTLPAEIAELAYQNKSPLYHLLFQAASETLLTIAADPKRLGAQIGALMVLPTWGSALTHHPHVHCVVPGGGLSLDGQSWIACRSGFFLPVRVLSRLFRCLFLSQLKQLFQDQSLTFHGHLVSLNEPQAFARWLQPLYDKEWFVYAKAPFSGPSAVLEYLSRYTHRVAISNQRLLSLNEDQVTFKYKDYREPEDHRQKTMTLAVDEFMRRFLQHVLPKGFHRIRQCGILANSKRAKCLSRARNLLDQDILPERSRLNDKETPPLPDTAFFCPKCKRSMVILAIVESTHHSRGPPGIRGVAA